MRVAVTGTPGTGKTTATERVETSLDVVHLNDLIREAGLATGTDPDRGSLVADLDATERQFADREDLLVESHLAHRLPADRVVVLRCHPETLERRLVERGEGTESARENAEAEALDIVLSEAVDRHGRDSVYEVDTTGLDPDDVAAAIEAVVAGDRAPSAGEVEFLEYL